MRRSAVQIRAWALGWDKGFPARRESLLCWWIDACIRGRGAAPKVPPRRFATISCETGKTNAPEGLMYAVVALEPSGRLTYFVGSREDCALWRLLQTSNAWRALSRQAHGEVQWRSRPACSWRSA